MSDTSQAAPPPAAAPAAPAVQPAAPSAPAVADVPVQAPVDQPRPIGQQAPPKPEGQESNKSSTPSRREALANAFRRAEEAQKEAAKGQPPKKAPETQKQAKAPDKSKAETPEKAPEKAQPYREGGKFARDPAKEQAFTGDKSVSPGEAGDRSAAVPIKPLDERAPFREAPSRWSDQSKQEWNATPESVRGAVYRTMKEFQGYYQKAKADVEVMDEMRPYHELAVKQGTSLRRAFDNYWGIENKLRQDMVGGLDVIVQNVARSQGLVGRTGAPLTLRDVCEHVLSMTPEQHQLTQHRNHQSAAEQQLALMRQKQDQQDQVLNQILYQQKVTYTRAQVDAFADKNPRFDELSDLIKQELDLGFTLEVAYARADRLRPPTHAAQTRTQSAQTRKTSISGAPDGKPGNTRPSDGQRRTNGEAKHPTRRESLERAFRRASNGV